MFIHLYVILACAITACHRGNCTMPMLCPQCRQDLSFQKYWTEAQRRHNSPSVGGRNCCIKCYNQGPTPEDYEEVSDWLSKIVQWSATHQDDNYPWQSFMVSFLRCMDPRTRKDWSHKGLLPVRVPTDYITNCPRGKDAFDPRNESYAIVIRREVPRLSALMSWGGAASKELCGDCIEALMAAAQEKPQRRGPELEGLADEKTWQEANSFFTEYAYAVWRILRVVRWHEDTVKFCTQEVLELLERVDACFSARDCFPTQRTIPLPDHVHPPVSVASSSGATPAERELFPKPEDLGPQAKAPPSSRLDQNEYAAAPNPRSLCQRCGWRSTMFCSSCQVAGCGLCIIFSSNSRSLLCRNCRQPQQ